VDILSWRTAMIRVSVMYPNTPNARFNHEYYPPSGDAGGSTGQ
jgi:hypothetical protein